MQSKPRCVSRAAFDEIEREVIRLKDPTGNNLYCSTFWNAKSEELRSVKSCTRVDMNEALAMLRSKTGEVPGVRTAFVNGEFVVDEDSIADARAVFDDATIAKIIEQGRSSLDLVRNAAQSRP
jgi:hypothetical protein